MLSVARKGYKTCGWSEIESKSRQFRIGFMSNTLNIVHHSSVAVCTIWTYAKEYYLVLLFIRKFRKVLRRVHQ